LKKSKFFVFLKNELESILSEKSFQKDFLLKVLTVKLFQFLLKIVKFSKSLNSKFKFFFNDFENFTIFN